MRILKHFKALPTIALGTIIGKRLLDITKIRSSEEGWFKEEDDDDEGDEDDENEEEEEEEDLRTEVSWQAVEKYPPSPYRANVPEPYKTMGCADLTQQYFWVVDFYKRANHPMNILGEGTMKDNLDLIFDDDFEGEEEEEEEDEMDEEEDSD